MIGTLQQDALSDEVINATLDLPTNQVRPDSIRPRTMHYEVPSLEKLRRADPRMRVYLHLRGPG